MNKFLGPATKPKEREIIINNANNNNAMSQILCNGRK